MFTPLRLATALALAAATACGDPVAGETSATATTGTGTSTGTTSTTGVVTTTAPHACPPATSTGVDDEEDPTECAFVCDTPDHPPGWCDIWNDDCPAGQKCSLVSVNGDNAWDTTRCVPVAPAPDQLYEPCSLTGDGSDGLDTCDRGMICLPDEFSDSRVCIGFCSGASHRPRCADPEALCYETAPPWGLCRRQCDPLAQNCEQGNACIHDPWSGNGFLCILDASGDEGQLFDSCEYANACDPGLDCGDPTAAVECDPTAFGCCLPFCDLDDPTPCPGAGQECVPWYDDPCSAASFNTDVGTCARPPATSFQIAPK